MQSSFFDLQSNQLEPMILPMQDATVAYVPGWIASRRADDYYHHLTQSLSWSQDTIKLYGKEHLIPRLQAWYGDPQSTYRYSGMTLAPLPWEPVLDELKVLCSEYCENGFNAVLANWYQHGQHSMGMHSDDEPELGIKPIIASLSFGADRVFIFKHKKTKQQVKVTLTHGSLLIMSGETQRYWQHGINKTAKPIGGRLNLTFRRVSHDHTATNYR
ncbi:alpha-ketoglutarate-dependent dioxygenase AlkB family protein [Alteromonas facilis]|uniref:alpha-ketoglutarate-dependent dioxygenase AlkB family protein n=1 Tax=Alteromonas facilis TaxID=2048004 RepID=UPI000C28C428|nr:alpha-ketoglutarate-dependent dioxygenase AlkB [Alteromonas facilis]